MAEKVVWCGKHRAACLSACARTGSTGSRRRRRCRRRRRSKTPREEAGWMGWAWVGWVEAAAWECNLLLRRISLGCRLRRGEPGVAVRCRPCRSSQVRVSGLTHSALQNLRSEPSSVWRICSACPPRRASRELRLSTSDKAKTILNVAVAAQVEWPLESRSLARASSRDCRWIQHPALVTSPSA